MIVLNQTTLSKGIPICAAMIKVGYMLMALGGYFQYYFTYTGYTSYRNAYYEVGGAFLAGLMITLLLTKNVSRFVLLMLTESIFVAIMIIAIFASSELKAYGLMFGGGVSLVLYPIYAREHFFPSPMNLKDKLVKKYSSLLMALLWLSLCVGVIYYFIIQKQQFDDYSLFASPIILSDNTTPYVFGSISIINMILLILVKQKETLYFYSKRGQTHEFNSLISEIYQSEYRQVMQNAYGEGLGENQYQNLIVSVAESNESANAQRTAEQMYQDRAIYFLPLVAGMSNILYNTLSSYQNLIILIEDTILIDAQSDTFTRDYYLYLLILIPMIVIGSVMLFFPQRRHLAALSMVVAFVLTFYFIVFDSNLQVTAMLALTQIIALFGGVASTIFSIPLLLEKVEKVVIYFMLFFLGTFANKLFINCSFTQNSYLYSTNYNMLILSAISQFLCICTVLVVQDY